MSRLPGRPDLTPKDVDSWVGALAQALALAEVHETPLDGAEGRSRDLHVPRRGAHQRVNMIR